MYECLTRTRNWCLWEKRNEVHLKLLDSKDRYSLTNNSWGNSDWWSCKKKENIKWLIECYQSLKCVILAVFYRYLCSNEEGLKIFHFSGLARYYITSVKKMRAWSRASKFVSTRSSNTWFLCINNVHRDLKVMRLRTGQKILLITYSALCKDSFAWCSSRVEEIRDSLFGCENSERLLLCLQLVMARKKMEDHLDVVVSTCHHDGRKSNFSLATPNLTFLPNLNVLSHFILRQTMRERRRIQTGMSIFNFCWTAREVWLWIAMGNITLCQLFSEQGLH